MGIMDAIIKTAQAAQAAQSTNTTTTKQPVSTTTAAPVTTTTVKTVTGSSTNTKTVTTQPKASSGSIPQITKTVPVVSTADKLAESLKPASSYKETPIAGAIAQQENKLYSPLTVLTSGGSMTPQDNTRLNEEATNIFFNYQLPIFEKAALASAAAGTIFYGATALPTYLAGSSLSSTTAAATAAGSAKAAGATAAGTAGATTIGKIITKTGGSKVGSLASGAVGFLLGSLFGGGSQEQTQQAGQDASSKQTQAQGISDISPTQITYNESNPLTYTYTQPITYSQQDTYSNIYQYGGGSINSQQQPSQTATPVINVIPQVTPTQGASQGISLDQLQGALSELGQQLSQDQQASQNNGLLLAVAAVAAMFILGDRKK